jgi:hypothetical protein
MVGQKIPMMPPYHPIYMHGQQNQMGAKPGANQASGNFMPRPHMMINHPQFFNSQMMNYGMPHPPPPSVAQGSSVSGNTDEKPNDNRPYQPAMYYSQWNPYMMSANPMMRNENGNNEQMNNVSRQTMVNPPVPYRLPPGPMMNLNGPKGMKPMPMNSTGVNNSNVGMNSNGGSNATPNQTNNPSVPGSINPNVGPNMNSNVGMFMPYSMDPRYSYMGYPYMPKKAEEPPRDPR